MPVRAAADEVQFFRNGIGQIVAEVRTVEEAHRVIVGELEVLADEGATDTVASVKLQLAYGALKLEAVLPRLQAVIQGIKEAAGPVFMARAAAPIVRRD